MSTHEELPIGPNPCPECGGEYGEHVAGCSFAALTKRRNDMARIKKVNMARKQTQKKDTIAARSSLQDVARSLRRYWQDKSTSPVETGFYLIYAPSADPKSPLIAMAWWNGKAWEGLVTIWLRAITHWMPLPKSPTKRPSAAMSDCP